MKCSCTLANWLTGSSKGLHLRTAPCLEDLLQALAPVMQEARLDTDDEYLTGLMRSAALATIDFFLTAPADGDGRTAV